MRSLLIGAAWLAALAVLFVVGTPARELMEALGVRWWHWAIVAGFWGLYIVAQSLDRLHNKIDALQAELHRARHNG